MGQIWGGLFFVFMTFASFSTVTAVFEALIGNCMDNFGWGRKKAVYILLPLVFFGSIPCVLGFNMWSDVQILGSKGILDTEDFIVSNLVLPIGSLILPFLRVEIRLGIRPLPERSEYRRRDEDSPLAETVFSNCPAASDYGHCSAQSDRMI